MYGKLVLQFTRDARSVAALRATVSMCLKVDWEDLIYAQTNSDGLVQLNVRYERYRKENRCIVSPRKEIRVSKIVTVMSCALPKEIAQRNCGIARNI